MVLVEAETRSAIDWARPCSGGKVIDRYRMVSTNVHLAGGPARPQLPVGPLVDACLSCRGR